MWLVLLSIYLLLLAGVSIIGLIKIKSIDTPAKIILTCIALTAISESIAHYLSISLKNNLVVYHIYNPVQFLLLCKYYNSIISFFKKYNTGIVIGITGIILSVLNSTFLQNPMTSFNTNFLVLESILIIGMTLCYFYDFLNTTHTTKQFATSDFWIACLLLVFWSFTFFTWAAGIALSLVISDYMFWIRYMMYAINIITYSGFGLVFLFYKKLQPV